MRIITSLNNLRRRMFALRGVAEPLAYQTYTLSGFPIASSANAKGVSRSQAAGATEHH